MRDTRKSIPRGELEELLLAKVRIRRGCEGVRQVTIIPREREGDWICGCVLAAGIDPKFWRSALTELETKFRQLYRLASRATEPKYKVVKIGPDHCWRGY